MREGWSGGAPLHQDRAGMDAKEEVNSLASLLTHVISIITFDVTLSMDRDIFENVYQAICPMILIYIVFDLGEVRYEGGWIPAIKRQHIRIIDCIDKHVVPVATSL